MKLLNAYKSSVNIVINTFALSFLIAFLLISNAYVAHASEILESPVQIFGISEESVNVTPGSPTRLLVSLANLDVNDAQVELSLHLASKTGQITVISDELSQVQKNWFSYPSKVEVSAESVIVVPVVINVDENADEFYELIGVSATTVKDDVVSSFRSLKTFELKYSQPRFTVTNAGISLLFTVVFISVSYFLVRFFEIRFPRVKIIKKIFTVLVICIMFSSTTTSKSLQVSLLADLESVEVMLSSLGMLDSEQIQEVEQSPELLVASEVVADPILDLKVSLFDLLTRLDWFDPMYDGVEIPITEYFVANYEGLRNTYFSIFLEDHFDFKIIKKYYGKITEMDDVKLAIIDNVLENTSIGRAGLSDVKIDHFTSVRDRMKTICYEAGKISDKDILSIDNKHLEKIMEQLSFMLEKEFILFNSIKSYVKSLPNYAKVRKLNQVKLYCEETKKVHTELIEYFAKKQNSESQIISSAYGILTTDFLNLYNLKSEDGKISKNDVKDLVIFEDDSATYDVNLFERVVNVPDKVIEQLKVLVSESNESLPVEEEQESTEIIGDFDPEIVLNSNDQISVIPTTQSKSSDSEPDNQSYIESSPMGEFSLEKYDANSILRGYFSVDAVSMLYGRMLEILVPKNVMPER